MVSSEARTPSTPCVGKQPLTARHAAVFCACCVQCLVPGAMFLNAQGIFYPVVAHDLGVQTAEISAWLSVAFISSAVFSLVVGNLISRIPLKGMRVAGILVSGLVMLSFSQATAPWMFWVAGLGAGYALIVLVSIGPAALINLWFAERVGMAMGVYACFTALGGVVFLMLGQAIIDAAGWRQAYAAFGALILALAPPIELLCTRESPRDCGLLPYGAPLVPHEDVAVEHSDSSLAEQATTDKERGLADANRALFTGAFWLLVLCGFLMNLVCQMNGYLPKYVLWHSEQAALGLSAGAFVTGAVLASACQTGSAIGKIALGSFSDFSVRNAVVALAACGSLGLAGIWALPSTALLPVASLVFGFFLSSALVLLPMLCRETFGTGSVYPVVYARVSVATTLGGSAGNIVWPWLADNLGGFDIVFGVAITCVLLVLTSALLALRHRRARYGKLS